MCDVCRNPRRKVQEYRLAKDGNRLLKLWLCSEHGEPLEQLIKIGTPAVSNAPDAKLWTIEEIEKEKQRLRRNNGSG